MFTAVNCDVFSFSLFLAIVPKYYTMSIPWLITRKINEFYCILNVIGQFQDWKQLIRTFRRTGAMRCDNVLKALSHLSFRLEKFLWIPEEKLNLLKAMRKSDATPNEIISTAK